MISVPGGSLCQPQRPSLLQPLCSSERLSKTCILSQWVWLQAYNTHTDPRCYSPSISSFLSSQLYQKPTIGYKSLMACYQTKVIHLATDKQKGEVQLVVNLFQSVLDGFIRGEMKKEEAEPAKVEHWHSSSFKPKSKSFKNCTSKFILTFCFFSLLRLERREGQKIKV